MGYQAEDGTLRNWFLTAAQELRDGVNQVPIPNMASPDMIAEMPLGMYFDALAMRLDADAACAPAGLPPRLLGRRAHLGNRNVNTIRSEASGALLGRTGFQ